MIFSEFVILLRNIGSGFWRRGVLAAAAAWLCGATANGQGTTSATVGETVTFDVTSDGWPVPTFQWRKNGVAIPGATGATFVIQSATLSDAGSYSVVATNIVGSATSPDVVLTVNAAPTNTAPTIQTQPLSAQTVFTGGSASFSVTATGTPSPVYQWKKNGVDLGGATAAALSLSGLTLNDAATYTVVVSNVAGTVTSSPAVLTVSDPPSGNVAPTIQTQPVSPQSALTGGSATFTVAASGSPAPTYQWKKDGADLDGATAATLVLTALTLNDSATYTVVVSNVAGSVTSSPAVLTVSDPPPGNPPPPPPPPPPTNTAPSFLQQPVASQSVTAGATVAFSGAATGTPAPTYQWQKNGVAIAGATDASLTLTGVADSDGGTYTLLATNVAGSATSNGSVLTVTALPPPPPPPPPSNPPPPPVGPAAAPAIAVQPVSLQTVVAGNTASLTVVASGNPAPTYQWRKNNVNITGANSSTFSLSAITAADAAVYSVVVANTSGSVVSGNSTLVVHSRPVIVRQPAAQAVALGTRATFTVNVTAIPGPSYQWRKNGVAIPGATASVLQIPAMTSADVGVYSVVATNPIGTATSFDAALQIAAPPVITEQPVAISSAAGSTASFTVAASGAPAPSYQWKRNGVVLPGATDATLTLKGVTTADEGVYLAEASNSLGYAVSASARLTVTASTGVGGSAGGGDSGLPGSQPSNPSTATSRIVNVSVRSLAGGDAGALIVGFVLSGGSSKLILARGVGPTLGLFGVAGALSDPSMGLYSGATVAASNDDWGTNTNSAQIADTGARLGAFSLPAQSADSAMMNTLGAGAYTVQLNGKGSAGGVALVEIYDAAAGTGASLVNLSVRAHVGAGPESPNLGFVISGNAPKRVMIRAVGPTLAAFGVGDVLADPRLQLFQGSTLVNENDNWGGGATLAATFASVGAFAFSDAASRDAALVVTLAPGAYTALVSGSESTSGVALIEVYEVP